MQELTFTPPDLIRPRRALLSVSDKTGLADIARVLVGHGIELVSTGGTAAALTAAGLPVTPIESLTGMPEMMDGRVKTLHPKVHGGLLAVRDEPSHAAALREHGIATIDLVIINLYPFEQTVRSPGCTPARAIENIDIGGPAMVRSAAKNHAYVAVVTDPRDYPRLAHELDAHASQLTLAFRADLAARAFALTARYDAAVAAYLDAQTPRSATRDEPALFPAWLTLPHRLVGTLRYGENPHQPAALYKPAEQPAGPTIPGAEILHGKELSYNNINDAAAALALVLALRRVGGGRPAACVIKHANPCGAAIADHAGDAVDEAILGDPVAAYGGILASGATITRAAAERLAAPGTFLEVIVAPDYEPEALELLRARSASLRILACGSMDRGGASTAFEARLIPGGLLLQRPDDRVARPDEFVLRAGPAPDPYTLEAAAFLECVVRALMSNAIAIGGPSPQRPTALRLFGAGAGQMDRVTACRLAAEKAGDNARGAVASSDAFFPFDDGPKILADAGVRAIVHPGGSKRDEDTFELCKARGVTCLTTGIRHFRH